MEHESEKHSGQNKAPSDPKGLTPPPAVTCTKCGLETRGMMWYTCNHLHCPLFIEAAFGNMERKNEN